MIALGLYFGAGLVFAAAFYFRGLRRLDPASDGSTLGFRLIILPGIAVLWPFLLVKWLRAGASQ